MAVIQISKIQVRRGLQENLPQLASAELGWSIDERKLYIGNGTLSEGAPVTGNTEILTEYTDILTIIQSYYFKGSESGYVSITSPDPLVPTYRNIRDKLDEQISIRDFGGIGDGIVDDTVAIMLALEQIYPISQSTNVKVRRTIYFPAGTYLISSELSIPSYAHLIGDTTGTSIVQTNSAARSVLTIGEYVSITGMTLQNITDNDVVYVDSVNTAKFTNINFVGNQTSPTTLGTSKGLVRVLSDSATTSNINLDNCTFSYASYAVIATNDVFGINITNSKFMVLYQGINISGTVVNAPNAIRVKNSIFNDIASSGIVTDAYSNITSAFNYYQNVGNGLESNPLAPVITYANPNNYSIADIFDRTVDSSTVYPYIQSTGAISANSKISLSASGSLQSFPGVTDIISSNLTLANTSLILSTVSNSNATIDYNITRGANVKTGTMTVAINTAALNQFYYEDSFTEYPAGTQYLYGVDSPTGIDLTFVAYGNNLVLTANTSSTGGDVTLKYNVRHFL